MIVLDILMLLLWVVGGVVVLALVMPLHYRAEGSADDDDGLWWRVRVAWGFGLVALHASSDGAVVRVLGIRVARLREDDADTRAEKRAKKRKKKAARRAKRDARARRKGREPRRREGARRWGLRQLLARQRVFLEVARRYVRALHLRGRVEGVVGLADPAETARLFPILDALEGWLPEGTLAVDVDWVEEVVALEGRVGGWVWPLQLAGITLVLFIDRKAWRALRAA